MSVHRVLLCAQCRGKGCFYFHAGGRSWTEKCTVCNGHGKLHPPPAITASDFAPMEKRP